MTARYALVKSPLLPDYRFSILSPPIAGKSTEAICCNCNTKFEYTSLFNQTGEDPYKFACSRNCAVANGWMKAAAEVTAEQEGIKWIVVNAGDIFEGTPNQFRDCFFPNCNRKTINDWCSKNSYTVEFLNYLPKKAQIDTRSPPRKVLDERIADEPRLPVPKVDKTKPQKIEQKIAKTGDKPKKTCPDCGGIARGRGFAHTNACLKTR